MEDLLDLAIGAYLFEYRYTPLELDVPGLGAAIKLADQVQEEPCQGVWGFLGLQELGKRQP